jgi:UDP-N-acetylglucosamine--N-acetylmuramyl-(pentapeptide) pyrophosphoryl-undecaprenol N-acetylglucosamine transferase
MGIPCYAHESDFSPGLANRLSAPCCKKIFTSFPETAKKFKRGVYSGAPIKRSVLSASRAEARLRMQIAFDENVLLVFGGGSGSACINEAVRKQLKTLTQTFTILHVCGEGNIVQSNVENYHQFEFISDMGAMYACADVVIARAGAGTIFEVLALKKPALLVPLERQTRGDQIQNAQYFSRKGLCRILPQAKLNQLADEAKKTLWDEGLQQRLQEVPFTSGNEKILQALERELRRE